LEADPALGVAFSDFLIEAGGRRHPRGWAMSPGRLTDPLKTVIGPRNPVCFSAALLRASAWRQVRDSFPTDPLVPADVPLWVGLAQAGWGFFGVDERLVVWREHPRQITAQAGLMRERGVRLWETLHFSRRDCERLRRAQLADALIGRAGLRLRERDAPGTRADLLRAMRTSPRAWRFRAAGLALLLALPALVRPVMSLRAGVQARKKAGPTSRGDKGQ
jgi:hypothetical protein